MAQSTEERIVLLTSDNAEVHMDKHELCWTSKVFQDLFSSCQTGESLACRWGVKS